MESSNAVASFYLMPDKLVLRTELQVIYGIEDLK